ncbi:transglutaminase family protein [bacterium]|nr:MAG: transglutaminase family protein [bacterium]
MDRFATVFHPGFMAEVAVSRQLLSDSPDLATAETISTMAAYVRADSRSEIVRRALHEAVPEHSSVVEVARAVHRWIRARVRFVEDEVNAGPFLDRERARRAEVLIRPVDLLRMALPSGDCDDFVMLAAAMFRAAGIETEFVTVAASSGAPAQFTHVYLYVVDERGSRIPFDASHGPNAGWEVENRFNKLAAWPIDDPARARGLAGTSKGVPMMGRLRAAECGPVSAGYDVECAGASGGVPWWQQLISGGLNIASKRYAVPPQNTYVDPSGRIIRGSAGGPFPYPGLSLDGGGSNTGLLVIGGVALVGLVLMVVSKGRR